MDTIRRPGVIAALRVLCRVACLSAFLMIGFALTSSPAKAQIEDRTSNSACILCHADRSDTLQLPNGEELPLGIDLNQLNQSVHGDHGGTELACTDCHRSRQRYQFPHADNPAASLADFEAEIADNCQTCHVAAEYHNPGHLNAEETEGLPICTDCHGGHDVALASTMADPEQGCTTCHDGFSDPKVEVVHRELAANMSEDQNCRTCHTDEPLYAGDTECRLCHSLLTSQMLLPSGETIDLQIDPSRLAGSVHGLHQIEAHGQDPLLCTDCHRDQQRYGFPHPEMTADTHRALTLDMEHLCTECHAEVVERQGDGVHALAMENGNASAATCADCHGSHAIEQPNEPRQRISETCSHCHQEISQLYVESVHGAALLGEDNPDVPVCTDCHGVHDIGSPNTAIFRVNSPDMCAACHADEEMMGRYGISTDVFDTYVADFHGTTVELFEKQSPDQPTNKAVCYDCHGIHDIRSPHDENSHVIRENLLETCRSCHPDATANFPDAWTSHFKPSMEHNPLVYLVNRFYQILIPLVIGGFALFIGTDLFRTASDRWWRRKGKGDERTN